MNGPTIAILVVSGVFSVACWVALWRNEDRLFGKLAWTVIAAVPVLGPLLYAGMHHAPPVQDEIDRAPGGAWDIGGGEPPTDSHHP